MASNVEIVNAALTLLGESRIISLDDDVKPARESKAIFDMCRDALLAGYNWSFAMERVKLSAMVDAPSFGYSLQYQMPSDCLRLVMVGDSYVGLDLTDYRGSPTEEFAIDGRRILTDMAAPLPIRYVKRVEDSQQFHPNFVKMFSAKLAMDLCESLTQSDTKYQRARDIFKDELMLAIRANAIELPPRKLPDDEWLMSRL